MKHVLLFVLTISFALGQSGFIKTPEQLYKSIDNKKPSGDELFNTNKLPKKIDLSPYFPEPGYQGKIGSCASWALGYACKSYQEAIEHDLKVKSKKGQFSPSFIYNQVNDGLDKGSTIPAAFQLVMDKGCATLENMPYTQDYLLQPSKTAFREAEQYKISHYKRLENGPGLLPAIRSALINGEPVIIAMKVYDNFRKLKNKAYREISGDLHGGHGMCIIGYDDDDTSLKAINSWGNKWGEKGYCRIDYSLIGELFMEAYICSDIIEKEKELSFPKNLKASQGSNENSVTLNWDAVNNADAYEVYRTDNKKENLKLLKKVKVSSYQDEEVLDKVKYLYAVKSLQSENMSILSEIACGWSSKEELGIPGELRCELELNKVTLHWLAVEGAEKYNIYRWQDEKETYRLIGQSLNTTYTDNESMSYNKEDQLFYYVLTSIRGNEESIQSNMASIRIPGREEKDIIPFEYSRSKDIVVPENERKNLVSKKESDDFYNPDYMQQFFEIARKAEEAAFKKMKESENKYFDDFKKYEEEQYKKYK